MQLLGLPRRMLSFAAVFVWFLFTLHVLIAKVPDDRNSLNRDLHPINPASNLTGQSNFQNVSFLYEKLGQLGRSVKQQLEDLMVYVEHQFKELNTTTVLNKTISDVVEEIRTRKSAAIIEADLLQDLIKDERTKEMRKLQELVSKRLLYLQNPSNCSAARKLTCTANKSCGFGCQVHHIAHCLLVALGTNRTFALDSRIWRYSTEGWESFFMPVSETCNRFYLSRKEKVIWRGEEQTKNVQTISLNIIDVMRKKPPYLPPSVPEDLAPVLSKYHGYPSVWWLGQIVKYLLRPQPWLHETLERHKRDIGFENPIVGIHVRRTDKIGSEAAFHKVEEYMTVAEEWFTRREMRIQRASGKAISLVKRIYVATDEGSVLDELRNKYPNYHFLGDPGFTKHARPRIRYSEQGLLGIVTDVFLLSLCDFIVGTFSSQVSRLSYELMQTNHADASSFAHSLDDFFYFGGQNSHLQQAIYDHKPKHNTTEDKKEISMKAGDNIEIYGNYQNGYSFGKNLRTNMSGIYPSFKVKEIVSLAKFPTYHNANNFYVHNKKVV